MSLNTRAVCVFGIEILRARQQIVTTYITSNWISCGSGRSGIDFKCSTTSKAEISQDAASTARASLQTLMLTVTFLLCLRCRDNSLLASIICRSDMFVNLRFGIRFFFLLVCHFSINYSFFSLKFR